MLLLLSFSFSTIYQSTIADAPTWKHTSLGLIRAFQGERVGTVIHGAKDSAKAGVMQLIVREGCCRLYDIDDTAKDDNSIQM